MYIAVCGAPGTCKSKVREFLGTKGIDDLTMAVQNPTLDQCISITLDAFIAQTSAEDRLDQGDCDVVLSSTVWETYEVYVNLAVQKGFLSARDVLALQRMYDRYFRTGLRSPDFAICLRSDYFTSAHHMGMYGGLIPHHEWDEIRDRYDAFFDRIGVTKLVFDIGPDIAPILEEIDILVQSTRLQLRQETNTIWGDRTFIL